MHGTMAVVVDGIDGGSYCLAAISVSVCSDRLSMRPPIPSEHPGESVSEQKECQHILQT